jgi:DNA primase
MYLCLDNDKPGKEATERISRELLANDKYSHINMYIAQPPESQKYRF